MPNTFPEKAIEYTDISDKRPQSHRNFDKNPESAHGFSPNILQKY